MKILDTPRINRCGNQVFYLSPFGQCARSYCCPRNTLTTERQHIRSGFGYYSRGWRAMLTEEGRQLWIAAGAKVPTARTLTQSGFRSGQQHWVAVNVSQFTVGEAGLMIPPDPVVFGPNPVLGLSITTGENGPRLLLNLSGPITEKIMVFGQAPCSAGRNKHRNVSYLGLAPAPIDGVAEITALYVARYGEPKPGEKVFIVTRQQKNGWEDHDKVTSDIVPGTPGPQQAPAEPALPLNPYMHTGCTPGAKRNSETPVPRSQDSGVGTVKGEMTNDEPREGHANGERPAAEGRGGGGGQQGG
jgi:hypothetical protein